jgi:O-antigen ligase
MRGADTRPVNKKIKLRQALATIPFLLSVVGLSLRYVGFSFGGLRSFSVAYLCIALSLAGAVLATLAQRRPIKVMRPLNRMVVALYLFNLAVWVSAAFAGEAEARAAAIRITALIVWSVVMAVYATNVTALRVDFLCRWFSLWLAALAVTALTDFAGWTSFYNLVLVPTARSGGLLGGPNNAALLLTIGLVIRLPYSVKAGMRSPGRGAVEALIVAVLISGIVVTGSRTGYLLALLGFVSIAVSMGVRGVMRIMLPAGLVLAIAATAVLGSSLQQKLLAISYMRVSSMASVFTTGAELRGGSVVERIYLAKDAINRSLESPVVGIGIGLDKASRLESGAATGSGGLQTARGGGIDLVNSSHNTYLSVLLEMGVLGIMPFLVLVTAMGHRFHRRFTYTGDWSDLAIFVSFVLFCAAMATQTLHLNHNLLYYLFLPLALGMGGTPQRRQDDALFSSRGSRELEAAPAASKPRPE